MTSIINLNDENEGSGLDMTMSESEDSCGHIECIAKPDTPNQTHADKETEISYSTIEPYAEAAGRWLNGLSWNPYPPLLSEKKAFGEDYDDDYEDVDPLSGIRTLYSDSGTSNDDRSNRINAIAISNTAGSSSDHREFLFAALQNFASNKRICIGPLTQDAVSAMSKFSTSIIDDALSSDDDRVCSALCRILGEVDARDTVVGEVLDERKWDIAEEIAIDCVDFIVSRVSQEVDFYASASEINRADPTGSMILAETDWLLYEMTCFIADEPADFDLYQQHFFGPSEDEKKKRRALELQMRAERERKSKEAPASLDPVSAVLPLLCSGYIPSAEQAYGFGILPPPPPIDTTGMDPNSAEYWQTYYECQQQAAFIQSAAFTYSARQRAHYAVAQVQAFQNSTQPTHQDSTALSSTTTSTSASQNKKSLALKFVQSALKAKSGASSATTNSSIVSESNSEGKNAERGFSRDRKDEPKKSKDRESSRDRREESSRHKRRHDDDDDERQPGPIYCMVTNIRNDSRASEVERAAERYGRIETVKILRDKSAKPPDNGLASITFKYVYKRAFERLLSNGLSLQGKHRPTARLQSDPFGS